MLLSPLLESEQLRISCSYSDRMEIKCKFSENQQKQRLKNRRTSESDSMQIQSFEL